MTRAERTLLVHRLRDLAGVHTRCHEEDDAADAADAMVLVLERGHALNATLLREAADAIEAALPVPDAMETTHAR